MGVYKLTTGDSQNPELSMWLDELFDISRMQALNKFEPDIFFEHAPWKPVPEWHFLNELALRFQLR